MGDGGRDFGREKYATNLDSHLPRDPILYLYSLCCGLFHGVPRLISKAEAVMCIAKATSGSWEPPTLKERFDLPTEGFSFRSATSGHGANTRMLLSRQVKFDSRQKRNVAEFIVEPPCYGCVSCSKICPGWGVTEGHLLAMAPFAARHKTRRRKFLTGRRGNYPIFGQSVKRNIVNTNVYKTGNGSQNRDFGELPSEQNEFPREPSGARKKPGASNICTSRPGSPRERRSRPAGKQDVFVKRRGGVCFCQLYCRLYCRQP